jgi:hypothetical protein
LHQALAQWPLDVETTLQKCREITQPCYECETPRNSIQLTQAGNLHSAKGLQQRREDKQRCQRQLYLKLIHPNSKPWVSHQQYCSLPDWDLRQQLTTSALTCVQQSETIQTGLANFVLTWDKFHREKKKTVT